MPPEPLPWDRKDFFRDRKYGHDNRSEGFGPVARWRDTSSSSSSYGGGSNRNNNNDFSPRWGFPSDFRRVPGHGKQGGWHMYSEDSAHGYPTARSGDRFMDDDGFRPSMPRGDGRYGRFYRENRASFGQKEWRSYSWETNHHHSVLPNAPGRPHFLNDQRSLEDSPMRASYPYSDPCDQFQSKDQADKTTDVDGSGMGQRLEKENSPGSLDLKRLKWSRSGSLTSRGSGFSHSSSSKSLGGESNDLKGDIRRKNASPVQSPLEDAVAGAPSVVPLEETTSRKKPRLGWGEGLAKYEKKKVEGPEENASKVANATSPGNVEPVYSLASNLVDKSPRVPGFSDCSSPATPSSVACSSSPGLEDKAYVKVTDADGDANNFSVSSMSVSENQLEGLHFSLEKLELNSAISNLSSLLNELLQADEQYSMDSVFVKSSALNKLLLWKGDISKELEFTETEIDSLENELKSLKSDYGSNIACPTSLNSLSANCKEKSHEDVDMITLPLEMVSSKDMIVGNGDDNMGAHSQNKDGDIDSPGTATSKFVESCSFVQTDLVASNRSITQNLNMHTDVGNTGGTSWQGDDRNMIHVDSSQGACHPEDENICDTVITSNQDSAARASEVLFKLLPGDDCRVDFLDASRAPCLAADLTIRGKFLRRKRLLKSKEKVIALKYRAYQHLWKEDLRLLSLKSHRMKLQKKNDLGSRILQSGNQKHRSSVRSRFSSPAGSLSQVPTAEIISFTGKLLSESQVKTYRSSLKMPAMILDEKEKMLSTFVSSNGLVEDPYAMEKERALINPWTFEEKEIFMDKLSTHGKDFSKIASFLDHKTTADCIEFYYKNHKSECFEKTRKKPELKKQGKPLSSSTYLVTSEKKWSREMNAASLDILGAASVIAAQADEAMEPSIAEDERETAAADVLAGICGSLSSEAMSSCITSSVDPGDGNQQKVGSSSRRPLTPEVTQNVVEDDTCSDERCGEMDPIDWTDDEKSLLVEAFSSYGKDFVMISRCVRTKSKDQCKVFFSKARKCLGLDNVHPGTGMGGIHASNDANGGGSDANGSVVCSDKSGSRVDEDLPHINQDVSKPEALITELNRLDLPPANHQADESGVALDVGVATAADDTPIGADLLITEGDKSKVDGSVFTNEKSLAKSENGVNAKSCSSPSDLGSSRDGFCRQSTTNNNVHPSPSGGCTMNRGESSEGIPLDLPIKTEMKVGPESEGRSFQNFYLRKCGQARNSASELPLLVKREDQTEPKTSRNGDVKLFGKILSKPASASKPTPSAQDMNGNSSSGNHDHDSFVGLENVPIRSYGFWDGTKIQTGFPSLPKYPSPFANYSISSSKTEKQPLPAGVSGNECNTNGVCVFSPREFNDSNESVVEYPVHRNGEGVQPFRLDMKQRRDLDPDPFPEVQGNGFEAMPGLQQQGKGLDKLNVVQGGGDLLVGGSCTGISDPVAALKLHYLRTQQYGDGHGGNGIVREENWRGKGDVGR